MSIVLAIYGLVDLILLLAAKVINERLKPIFHAIGTSKNGKRTRHEGNATERMCHLEEPTPRVTKISTKGRVTIPAELRERFGIRKGTRIDWKRDGRRLVLTPIARDHRSKEN